MKDFPDFDKAFDYENGFYLSCDVSRMRKVLSHYELFKMTSGVSGRIVECGVFKGASLARFTMFRELSQKDYSKKIVAFDTFGPYPETNFEADKKRRQDFIESAGTQSISVDQLIKVLEQKGCNRDIELVAGDICQTVPKYLEKTPDLKISLLNLDTDIYEPAVTILECFWPRMAKGGVLILDDYSVFPGETQAVNDYFNDRQIEIQNLSFCRTPCYIVKK
ncbi:MAG: dTDP-6-deoxy-L-hexose 3-O-methyltransferase [Planctomycetes bacterium]|nr:dTDP-6-deoxy-L-hexose 3-O-methyltransferase [Planctomycetota bacterium]